MVRAMDLRHAVAYLLLLLLIGGVLGTIYIVRRRSYLNYIERRRRERNRRD